MIRRLPAGSFREGDARRLATLDDGTPRPVSTEEPTPDVQAMVAQGYRAGYSEGFEQGREDGLRDADVEREALRAELGERLSAQTRLLEEARGAFMALNQALPAALDAFREELAERASELALLGLRHLFEDVDVYRACMRGVSAELAIAHAGAVAVHVAPGDRSLFDGAIEGTPVVEDPSLARGTCRIDHARGEFEASIAGRLKNVYESLVEALGKAPA